MSQNMGEIMWNRKTKNVESDGKSLGEKNGIQWKMGQFSFLKFGFGYLKIYLFCVDLLSGLLKFKANHKYIVDTR